MYRTRKGPQAGVQTRDAWSMRSIYYRADYFIIFYFIIISDIMNVLIITINIESLLFMFHIIIIIFVIILSFISNLS